MEAGQNLFLNNMMSKLEKAKEDLEKNNETLEEAKDKIRAFTNDNTFQGEAANTAKTQMETYILVANAMIQANDCDIADYYTLNHMLWEAQQSVGGDDLIGEVIVEQMNKAERMAEQDRERAVEIDRMQTKSHNPFADAWYQMKEIYYKKSAEDNEELYKEWEKKSDKYDEIENSTSSLFENGEQLRQQAENALRELGKNFNGKSFDVADDGEWKKELAKLMSEKAYIGIGDSFLTFTYLDANGKTIISKYGGDQNWFSQSNIDRIKETDEFKKLSPKEQDYFNDEDLNQALKNGGCPVIALMNYFYMNEGKTKKSKIEYMLDIYKYIDKHKDLRETLLENSNADGEFDGGVDDETYGFWDNMFTYNTTEDYLEEYMEKNGIAYEVEFEDIDDNSFSYIENSVKAKRPVIVSIDKANNDFEGVNSYYINEKGELLERGKIKQHDMTITGISSQYDLKEQKYKKYVEVSSWGQKMYIPYEEFEKNKDKVHIAEIKQR